MKVKNLLDNDFDEACSLLSARVVNDEYQPDIIVGILTGGAFVGRALYEQLKSSTTIYTELQLQREGSKQKSQGITLKILQLLPEFACNLLRMAEAKWLEQRAKKHTPKRTGDFHLDIKTEDILKQGGKKVLIVDDAVDTGTTLKSVLDYITNRFPDNAVKTAAITVTMSEPLVCPNYFLYNNHTLIRFPWSNDVKSKSNAKGCHYRS